jgi:(1->4)-alpha-D-glucan 1-alpha-D-glucosylmutase
MVEPALTSAQRTAVIPRATYRLQFHPEFTFNDAAIIVPYLARLGISHVYSSPILKARPGSMHGYDVVDHALLNPELGTQEDFDSLAATLHAHGMGLIVDIVPNHLGIMGNDNAWWLDVLENGPIAQYAHHFDIDWRPNRASLRNRVLVPVLGDSYGAVLERGELQLVFDATKGSFNVRYFEHQFPIDPREYPKIFAGQSSELPPDDPDRADFDSLLTAFEHLPARDSDAPDARAIRYRDKDAHKRRLVRLLERAPAIGRHIELTLQRINGSVGDPASFDALDALIDAQAYRLAYWRVAGDEINYRRFFDVNDLAALRMNEPEAFERTHELIFRLVDAGKIDGLRIDHSDGLFDPQQYFEQVQQRFRNGTAVDKPLYVVTEKILATHERLPTTWAVHGTTGYDFTALVNGWLICGDNEDVISRIYRHYAGVADSFEELAYHARRQVMRTSLAAEVEVLATQLDRIAQRNRRTADFTRSAMRESIVEVIACFPVYRTYVSARGVGEEDRRIVQWAVNVARRRAATSDLSIFDFLRDVLLCDAAADRSEDYARAVLEFAMKFQQVTSPVAAKGVEDTAFYRYFCLVALNEVGADPRRFSFSGAAIHQENLERARSWPHSMLATSTHDTKRSEDARARIAVISEMPERWRAHLARWTRLNRSKHAQLDSGPAPTRNDEYLLYQSLLGVWTADIVSTPAAAQSLSERLQAYIVKATREAKRSTSWMNPNADYEHAVTQFVARLLDDPEHNAFLRDFAAFAQTADYFGKLNSLSQAVLKLTAPGVPDLYQGTERFSYALVDPDNRRPVAFDAAARELTELASMPADSAASDLLQTLQDGRLKHWVVWKLLQLRQQYADVFASGDYEPLQVAGAHKDHVLAFARKSGNRCILVVLSRWAARLMHEELAPPLGEVWGDTTVNATQRCPLGAMQDVLTQSPVGAPASGEVVELRVGDLLRRLPFAVLVSVDKA